MPAKKKKVPVSKADDAQGVADKNATRYAALKRQVAPLVAEIEKLGGDLKLFFRANPDAKLDAVGFSILQRKQLDVKAVRAELGDRIAAFEKVTPVETLFVRQPRVAA